MEPNRITHVAGYIYQISAPNSNKVYVGQSIDPEIRWKSHLSVAGRAVKKYTRSKLYCWLAKHIQEAIFMYWPVENMNEAEENYANYMKINGFELLNVMKCGDRLGAVHPLVQELNLLGFESWKETGKLPPIYEIKCNIERKG